MKKLIRNLFDFLGYEVILRRKYRDENSKDYLRLSTEYKKYDVLKIQFGCGPRILKGWVNIDLFFTPYRKYLKYYTNKFYSPEIRGDRNDLFCIDVTKTKLPLPDSSVDVIFHEDFLEHLSQRDQFIFLAETFRVLKKGGVHRINTPDLSVSLKKTCDFSKGGVGVCTKEWDKNDHISVLTKNMLEEMANIIGYSKIVFRNRDESAASGLPKEYRPATDRGVDGNIFADLIK